MRIPPVLAAGVAGAVLATGGIAVVDLATQSAGAAQGSSAVTQAQLDAKLKPTNQRSQAAINGYKKLNNTLGKYVNEPGELIGASSGPIKQDRGVGGGLPASVLAPGVPTPGTPGPQGPAGLSAFETVSASPVQVLISTVGSGTATCPAGKVAISGGVRQTTADGTSAHASTPKENLWVISNARSGATQWSAKVANNGTLFDWYFVVSVNCAIVDP